MPFGDGDGGMMSGSASGYGDMGGYEIGSEGYVGGLGSGSEIGIGTGGYGDGMGVGVQGDGFGGEGYGYGNGNGGQNVYHNVWATMTCSWAEEF
jgi:hypothetical protein